MEFYFIFITLGEESLSGEGECIVFTSKEGPGPLQQAQGHLLQPPVSSLNYLHLIHEIQTRMISPFCHNLLKKIKALNLISTEI